MFVHNAQTCILIAIDTHITVPIICAHPTFIDMGRSRKKKSRKLTNLRNVGRTLFPVAKSSPEKEKIALIANAKTRLSPCLASQKRHLSGLKGKKNRHTKRPELEIFQRRRLQRKRIVAAQRKIVESKKETLAMVIHLWAETSMR